MTVKPTYEELERRVEELEQQVEQYQTTGLQYPPQILPVLMEAFRYIPICKTFEDAAKEIFYQCKHLTGARSGYVALLSENGKENEVLFLDAGGMPCDVDPNLPMPIRGLRETAYKNKDVAYDNTFPESPWMELMPEGHLRLDNVLFAPLNIEHKTVGVIGIANKPGGFNEQDVYVSKIMGDLAAVALTYAKSQGQLKNSEELFRTIFEQSAVGIAQVTPDGRFKSVNSKFVDIIGYSKDELARMSFDEITYPDDLNKEKKIIDRIIKGEIDSFEIEKRYIHKNGDLVWIKLYSNVVRDKKNNIQYAVASVIDNTEWKMAETALLESEEKYRQITESMNEVFWLRSADNSEMLYVSPAYEKVWGRTCQSLYENPQSFIDSVYDEDKPAVFAEFEKDMKGEGFDLQYRIIRPDKGIRWIRAQSFPVKNNAGDVIKHTGIAMDITDRKQAEAEQEKLHAQLHQTQKMKSIGSLAGGIAHDFNNILFPIIGNSQLMIDDFDPGSPEHESLKAIMDAGERGKNLVQQILAIGRQSEQQPIPVKIQMVLKEVLKLIRSTIPANVNITQDIRKDCGTVKADPTQLHQIAMNLITNASHAMEDDVGEIAVRLKEVDLETEDFISKNLEPGRYAVLTVSDTGCGIADDMMEKIFDPYFTTKEQEKGTGLGLSVVHGIVKSYGGDITVYSELGKGTSFHVYLPVINKTAEIEKTVKNRSLPTGNERILVVDDEAPIIQLEETLLKKLGYEVSSRTGSIDALEKFKMDPYAFDLVLTDMSMPNMTGEKLAREMISIRPDIPVILCTGFSERIDEQKAENIGVKAFLMKPSLNRDIAQTVRNVLDEAQNTSQ